ncbi:hypothetical protein FQN49_001226 [Arthroderma sp. PD_2]|nr:hypothetical protein FQN49_001226 [Arthroderma sp. PD_2]
MGDNPSSEDIVYQQAKPLVQAIPQLSCALCRDRKLKCDKLDPCTNCTTSGAVCVPIHRPRLPRGRHARRARAKTSSSSTTTPPSERRTETSNPTAPTATNDSDLTARVHRLESLVQRGEVEDELASTAGQDLNHRIRILERLVQGVGSSSTETVPNKSITRSVEDSDAMQVDAPILQSPTRWSPEFSVGGQDNHFWAEFMDDETHEPGDEDSSKRSFGLDTLKSDIGALGLLGSSNPLYPSPKIIYHRDKVAIGKLCHIYLHNVDPIIKILHRPSIRKWMVDGDKYLGYPEEHTSVRALESAVCYAAANSMTDSQCQAAFQASKSSIVAAHRRMCERAIESANLLTTRDMIVLQAFVLYLVGRRSEEKGTAVWALVALAVRLTKAMSVNQDPAEAARDGETFFHQQMRLRLWLTVCLMDLQTSFAESSEPLISHRDVASAVPHVRHVNDHDFGVDTTQPVADREELTETTFALVTYRVQIAGRLLNFATPDWSSSSSIGSSTGSDTSPSPAALLSPEERQRQARHFQQQALGLLHFCDPESSAYAWFTWHSTQCLVSAIRLSELLPFQYSRIGRSPSPRAGSDTDLLRRTLQSLEKAQLIYSDPRGEGFRWYVTTPWLALSTAIAECNTCTDTALVIRAWPIIEASYQQYESFVQKQREQLSLPPLAKLMNQTRQRPSALLQGGSSFDENRSVNNRPGATAKGLPAPMLPTPVSCVAGETPIDPSLIASSGSLPASSIVASDGPSYVTSTQPFAWNLTPFSTELTSALDNTLPAPDLYHQLPSSSSDLFEPSRMTTDIMSLYSHLQEETAQLATGEGVDRDTYSYRAIGV